MSLDPMQQRFAFYLFLTLIGMALVYVVWTVLSAIVRHLYAQRKAQASGAKR